MGPPPPAGEEKIVIMKAVGGEMGSASALAPKLGPLGLVSRIFIFILIIYTMLYTIIIYHNNL